MRYPPTWRVQAMVHAYSQLKRILRSRQMTVPQLKKQIEERGQRINIKSLYRLSQEADPDERLDLRLAGMICKVCKINLADLIAYQQDRPKLRRFPNAQQRRLTYLMNKNNEGDLNQSERKELETLVHEAQIMTLENARTLLAHKKKL